MSVTASGAFLVFVAEFHRQCGGYDGFVPITNDVADESEVVVGDVVARFDKKKRTIVIGGEMVLSHIGICLSAEEVGGTK